MSPSDGVILLAFAGLTVPLVAWWLWREARRTARYNERLRNSALVGTGKVLEIEPIPENDTLPQMTLTLEIQLPGQPPRRARVYHHCQAGREPRLGDRLPLRVHPDHPEDIYLEG